MTFFLQTDIILFIRHLFVLDELLVTGQWLILGSCCRTSKCGYLTSILGLGVN